MYAADGSAGAGGAGFASVAEALRAGGAFADFLNSPAAAGLDGPGCGAALRALGEIQGKLAAAYASFLRRFDAVGGHAADGYGSASAWLAAQGQLTRKDARAAVREMRRLGERPELGAAVTAGAITRSWALAIAGWTRKLPAEMRDETDRILLDAAAAGASLDDLSTIAACAIEKWRQQQPDPDNPDDGFDDRYVQVGTTFGGAAVIRGDLTPECAAAVRAVLEALGKKAGPEDDRTEGKRFHDALQLACTSLPRVSCSTCELLASGSLTAVSERSRSSGCSRRRLLLGSAEGGVTVNLDEIKALGSRLAELCRKYGIAELAVFGSVARGDAGPDSDVDLLYVRVPGNDLGMAYFDLQDDLERLFGHQVDLVAKDGLHRVIREQVLADAQVLYAA